MLKNLALALTEALQDEYKARATYRAILKHFGSVRPFVNIVESEERHIQSLLPLFARYGIPVPEDNWPVHVTVPDTLTQACHEGVQAEIENRAMYERLLALTTDYPDVQQVFRNLQRASQENHLPAFQRCATRAILGVMGSTYGAQSASAEGRSGTRGCGKPNLDKMSGEASTIVPKGYGQPRRYRMGRRGSQ